MHVHVHVRRPEEAHVHVHVQRPDEAHVHVHVQRPEEVTPTTAMHMHAARIALVDSDWIVTGAVLMHACLCSCMHAHAACMHACAACMHARAACMR